MTIEYSKLSMKAIARMDRPTGERIRKGIEGIPKGDIKPIYSVKGGYRLRVGDWRILFEYEGEDKIYISKISPRGDVYKGV